MSVEVQRNGPFVIVEVVGHIIEERLLNRLVIIVYQPFRSPNINLGWNLKASFHAFQVEAESFVIEQSLKSFLGLAVRSTLDQPNNFLTYLKLDQSQSAGKLPGRFDTNARLRD